MVVHSLITIWYVGLSIVNSSYHVLHSINSCSRNFGLSLISYFFKPSTMEELTLVGHLVVSSLPPAMTMTHPLMNTVSKDNLFTCFGRWWIVRHIWKALENLGKLLVKVIFEEKENKVHKFTFNHHMVKLKNIFSVAWSSFNFTTVPGLQNEPKWGHLRALHKAIKQSEPALVSTDPKVTSLGYNLEVKSLIWFAMKNNRISCALKIHFIPFVDIISGTCVLNPWCLCGLHCKLWHQILCKSYVWKWTIWSTTLVYQYSSWLQNCCLQHRKGNTILLTEYTWVLLLLFVYVQISHWTADKDYGVFEQKFFSVNIYKIYQFNVGWQRLGEKDDSCKQCICLAVIQWRTCLIKSRWFHCSTGTLWTGQCDTGFFRLFVVYDRVSIFQLIKLLKEKLLYMLTLSSLNLIKLLSFCSVSTLMVMI